MVITRGSSSQTRSRTLKRKNFISFKAAHELITPPAPGKKRSRARDAEALHGDDPGILPSD